MEKILLGKDVDTRLNWPIGRAQRLAKRGKLPHLRLADGSIRFLLSDVQSFVAVVSPDETINAIQKDMASRGLHCTTGLALEEEQADED